MDEHSVRMAIKAIRVSNKKLQDAISRQLHVIERNDLIAASL